jgi:hypothetical protein
VLVNIEGSSQTIGAEDEAKMSNLEMIAMLRLLLHAKKGILVVAVCAFSCALTGCLESTFDLANESRLPQGLATPFGVTRKDVSVTLDFYTPGPAQLTLRDKNGKKLASVTGEVKGDPIYLKTPPDPLTPAYEIIVINGVTEIMECIPYRDGANMTRNGRIVALFKVVDDPALKKELLAGRGLH